jgi:hypothetical protein
MMSRLRTGLIVATLILSFDVCAKTSGSDTMLQGAEVAALRLAVDDFIEHHYSTSADLVHYRLRLHRAADKLEIDFIPDTDSRGPRPGGGTDYGREVFYTVSIQPLKIVSSQLAQ